MPSRQVSSPLQTGTGDPNTGTIPQTAVDGGLYLDTNTGILWAWNPGAGGAGTGAWVAGLGGGAMDCALAFPSVGIVSATSRTIRYVHRGPDMRLENASAAIDIALLTGDATITFTIDGGATLVVMTLVQAGSAPGDVFVVNNFGLGAPIISDGETLEMTIGGTQTAAAVCDLTVHASWEQLT